MGGGGGDFLKRLNVNNNLCFGIDPALPSDVSCDGLYLRSGYCEDIEANEYALLVCRHTLEHITNPPEFLSSCLKGNIPCLYFEIPRIEWLIARKTYFALTYEHCSWFTQKSLIELFHQFGYMPTKFIKLFDDEYLGIQLQLGSKAGVNHEDFLKLESLKLWFSEIQKYYCDLSNYIHNIATQGKTIAIWGIAGKGVNILTNLSNNEDICYAIDTNPAKDGMYVPITGHKIYHPTSLEKSGYPLPEIILLTNKMYAEEIKLEADDVFSKWKKPIDIKII